MKNSRRIVTGHTETGRSTIVQDGQSPTAISLGDGGLVDFWETKNVPASNHGNEEAVARPLKLEPPEGGTLFRAVVFPPDAELAKVDTAAIFKQMGAEHTVDRMGARHPGFHRTNTVDYAIILEGEIYAMMDEGETLMKQGDVLVQRGTNHAWSNRSSSPCTVAFILVDAAPLT